VAANLQSIDTNHGDMIHDAQLDYYGRRLATCSSDRTIKIFEIGEDEQQSQQPSAILNGHEGPVWEVEWLHPKFGNILASCSYDRKVIIWKEENQNQWQIIYLYNDHKLSVNSISWAPHTAGCRLACGSSDGRISILTHTDAAGQIVGAAGGAASGAGWRAEAFAAHQIGVNCVAWAPQDFAENDATQRLASGGCDNLVKIWVLAPSSNEWKCEHELALHGDWVRDVAWAPRAAATAARTLASAAQDGSVAIWTQRADGEAWQSRVLPKFPDVVWRLSWSLTGGILAVSGGDNRVTLWKENADGAWSVLSTVNDKASAADGEK